MQKTIYICDCCRKEFDPSIPVDIKHNRYLNDKKEKVIIVNPCIIIEGNYYDNTATPFTRSYELCRDCTNKIIDVLTKGENNQ